MRPPTADGLAKPSSPCSGLAFLIVAPWPHLVQQSSWPPRSAVRHRCAQHHRPALRQNETHGTAAARKQFSHALQPTNLRKPNRKPSETFGKRPKSTMSTFPNLPKPSHQPCIFWTSPKENAQNWSAPCALFKILKKAQATTFLEF